MKNFKTGTLIAIAAGGLFVSACKKDEAKKAETTTEPKKEEAVAPKPEDNTAAQPDKPADPAAAPAAAQDEKVAKVDCAGVNACKGQGSCKTEKHGCAGQNACKGQGVLAMTEEDCKAKGGTVASK